MISSNNNWCFYFPVSNKLVKYFTHLRSFTITEPANSSRHSLEVNFFLCQFYPIYQSLIFRECFHYCFICFINIVWISGECSPSEWSLPIIEQWPYISRDKAGEIKCIINSVFLCFTADVVAVVKGNGTSLLKFEHRFYMNNNSLF